MPKSWLLLNVGQMLQNTELLPYGTEFPGYILNLLKAGDSAQQIVLQYY